MRKRLDKHIFKSNFAVKFNKRGELWKRVVILNSRQTL